MTKDEAVSSIFRAASTMDNAEYFREMIRRTIDQIDQPPAEFSVREMVELIAPYSPIELFSDGSWICGQVDGQGIDSLRAKLIELAKPEDPEVMVPMRLSLVKCCAKYRDGEVAKACKTALEKAGVKL